MASRLARPDAKAVVAEIARSGRPLREALIADPRVGLSEDEIDGALDPAGYLGSAEAFVDRALEAHERSGDD